MRRILPPAVVLTSIATIGVVVATDPTASPPMRDASSSTTSSTRPPPSITTTTTLAPTTTTDATAFAAWSRVAVCEEGGWVGWAGANYPDSLGISAVNWYANGGGGDLSPPAQIAVAQRIEAGAGLAGYVPDQGGCAPW
jgi:hypothetical protein